MKTKKSEVKPVEVIMTMVVVSIIVFVSLIAFQGKTQTASKSINFIEVKSRNELCRVAGERIGERINEPIEKNDGDGYPDDCDLCLGGKNDAQVSNSYGIPNECYYDPAANKDIKNYKDMCIKKNGCYIEKTDQCCIKDKCKGIYDVCK